MTGAMAISLLVVRAVTVEDEAQGGRQLPGSLWNGGEKALAVLSRRVRQTAELKKLVRSADVYRLIAVDVDRHEVSAGNIVQLAAVGAPSRSRLLVGRIRCAREPT